jgi:hypothetical protein
MAKTGYSAVKQVAASYWYKIGGKTVTKAQYNAHSNKTGDGPTKSTNDPDASGNKSKTENNRSKNKESKKSTVLTKAQTEAKNKKNPKPKKSTESAHGQLDDAEAEYQQDLKDHAAKKKTPLKWGWKDTLDAAQTGLTAAGMIPGFGMVADAINTGIYGYREMWSDAVYSALAVVPAFGDMLGSVKVSFKALGFGFGGIDFFNNILGYVDTALEILNTGKNALIDFFKHTLTPLVKSTMDDGLSGAMPALLEGKSSLVVA